MQGGRETTDQDVANAVTFEEPQHRLRIEAGQLPLPGHSTSSMRALLEVEHVEEVPQALPGCPPEPLDDLIEVDLFAVAAEHHGGP